MTLTMADSDQNLNSALIHGKSVDSSSLKRSRIGNIVTLVTGRVHTNKAEILSTRSRMLADLDACTGAIVDLRAAKACRLVFGSIILISRQEGAR